MGNLCVGLVGGAGVVSGKNLGHQHAIFEQGARHKAGDIAGQNKANPTGMLLAAADMLDHLGCALDERKEGRVFEFLSLG